MTRNLADGIAWVKAHPTRQNVSGASYRIGYGWSWSQLCVALVFWALGATHTYDTANLARANSTIVSTDRNPPDGAIGWFSLGTAGHIGFFKGGLLYSATKFASNLGSALGTLTIAEYEAKSGGKWIGWGRDFGGQTFTAIEIADTGNVIPITETEFDMSEIRYYWKQAGATAVAYGIFGQELPGGNRISNNEATGVAWGMMYGNDNGGPYNNGASLTEDQWTHLVAESGAIAATWLAQQKAIYVGASVATVDLSDSDRAVLNAIAAKTYPTKFTGSLT